MAFADGAARNAIVERFQRAGLDLPAVGRRESKSEHLDLHVTEFEKRHFGLCAADI